MAYAATLEINGKSYGIDQALDSTWYWEQGDNDAFGFKSIDEAILDAKRHAAFPLTPRPEKQHGSYESQVID